MGAQDGDGVVQHLFGEEGTGGRFFGMIPEGIRSPATSVITPTFEALDFVINKINHKKNMKIVFPNPQGELWNHKHAKENSKPGDLIFICGHYKGIDERVVKKYVTHQYSLKMEKCYYLISPVILLLTHILTEIECNA